MISEADRYQEAGVYDVVRCPVHKQTVAVINGHLAGTCDACMAEAARGLRRLKRWRRV